MFLFVFVYINHRQNVYFLELCCFCFFTEAAKGHAEKISRANEINFFSACPFAGSIVFRPVISADFSASKIIAGSLDCPTFGYILASWKT